MKKKMSLNTILIILAIIIVFIIFILIGVIIYMSNPDNNKSMSSKNQKSSSNSVNTVQTTTNQTSSNTVSEKISESLEKTTVKGTTYYRKLNDTTWKGEYHTDSYNAKKSQNTKKVVSYKDYLNFINELKTSNNDATIKNYYTDENSNYIILSYSHENALCNLKVIDCVEETESITIYGDEEIKSSTTNSGTGYITVIPTKAKVGTSITWRECYSSDEITNIQTNNTAQSKEIIGKPIIYLYPTKEEEVSVKLLKEESITCSYPKYQGKWTVMARPNGDLADLSTNRNLYSLYYENDSNVDFKVENDGFVIRGEDSAEFLEEKLNTLGLTEREAEEFIVYWLPKLEANKYNYIRFATQDEINENMPLEINPNPDTIIRVLMTYKSLDNPIEVKEQQLTTPERKGFVAVEWGGTEIK